MHKTVWTQFIEHGYWKPALGIVLGSGVGFAYYYFIGCVAGACPIQSNPFLMTGYGALFGLILGIPGKKNEKDSSKKEPITEGKKL